MIRRAFFSSPYASYWGPKQRAIEETLRALVGLRAAWQIALHVDEVSEATRNVVWSPLIQGQFILRDKRLIWPETEALDWCLYQLASGKFNTLILSNTIVKQPNYGRNGCDIEREAAERLGLDIMMETDAL